MFCKGDSVIYPVHGIGTVVSIEKIEFDGEKRVYYKLTFPERSLSISVPTKTAEQIGLRKPLPKKSLKEQLSLLSAKKKFSEEEFAQINDLSQGLLNTGLVKDSISVIVLIRAFGKERKEAGKTLTTSSRNYLNLAENFLKQEVLLVLGEKAALEYGLE